MGDREALARLIGRICREVAELPDRTSPTDQPDQMTVSVDELAGIIERAAAGWRPPPEPQDSGLPPLEPLQQQPARFKLRVTETPPPLPIAEPQENEAARLRKIIALALAASDYGSIREVLWRGFDNGPPPEPQAGEVAERAREINKRIHIDCQAPRCSCSDGVCAVSETYIRDALLAEHARADARGHGQRGDGPPRRRPGDAAQAAGARV